MDDLRWVEHERQSYFFRLFVVYEGSWQDTGMVVLPAYWEDRGKDDPVRWSAGDFRAEATEEEGRLAVVQSIDAALDVAEYYYFRRRGTRK